VKTTIFSYRYAREILEHPNNNAAWNEIIAVVGSAPLFTYAGKSKKNRKLDVVQQLMNTYFDRAFGVENNWLYHPLATAIPNSGLAADFRKTFPNLTVQAEVQFGNMSRWYSDVFKFQTAYSQSLINVGLCVVPMGALARRIDSNVVSFERVVRELPSAELSLTLPILVIGVEADEHTPVIDLRQVAIPLERLTKKDTRAKRSETNRYRIVQAYYTGTDPHRVTERSEPGPMPRAIVDAPDDEDESEAPLSEG
jgi:hypothetical protein